MTENANIAIVQGALENQPTTITTSTPSALLDFTPVKQKTLLEQLAELVEPYNYTAEEAKQVSFARCANRRYSDESFEDYRSRLKRQAKIEKKYSRGVLVWDSSPEPGHTRGRTYRRAAA